MSPGASCPATLSVEAVTPILRAPRVFLKTIQVEFLN